MCKTKSRVWLPVILWVKLLESKMDRNTLLGGSCGLSRWILKSPAIITLFESVIKLDKNSANFCKISEYGPFGL